MMMVIPKLVTIFYIPDSVLISIHWLLLWCIHQKEDKNNPESNNPSVWTRDKINDFAIHNNKSRHNPEYVQYDGYINNKNQSTTDNNDDVIIHDNTNPSSVLLNQSSDHIRAKKSTNMNTLHWLIIFQTRRIG